MSAEASRRVYDALRPKAPEPSKVIRKYKEENSRAWVLITEYSTGEVELAERPTEFTSWGPPRLLRLVETERT